MQYCRLVLANDSGLMHLAAASGTPTLGLFGPTNEKQVGPRGSHTYTIRAPGTKPSYDTVTNYNLGTEPHPSLLALKSSEVVDKIARVVEQ